MTTVVAVLAALAALALALIARAVRVRVLQERLRQPVDGVPPEVQEVWTGRIGSRSASGLAMGTAAGVTVADALFQLHRIEPGVLTAIDAAKGEQAFDNYNQLVAHVEDVVERGASAVGGLVSNYKGYYGEQVLADTLRGQGHHVVMAPTPNQEGWDAIVDGQPVQFKSGLDESSIQEHLVRFPDIPVITVGDHAEAFSDNPMVTSLEGVSGSDIQEATESTLEGIDGLDDVGLDFPLVTLLVAGARNALLVKQGQSDGWTAVEYTAADTVAVGGGGALGGKTGAIIGGLLGGPVGAAIGGVIGAVAGGMAGRSLSNEYKERALREAQAVLDGALSGYPAPYVEALRAKGYALQATAAGARPSGLGALLWPSFGDVAAMEISRRYAAWSTSCLITANTLHERVRRAEATGELADLGRSFASDREAEPVYSPTIQHVRSGVAQAQDAVRRELGKLGRLSA